MDPQEKLENAISRGWHLKVAQAIAEGADVNHRNPVLGTTPLLWAVRASPNVKVVRALVAHGADVNMADEAGETPLMAAARKSGQSGTPLVGLLLDAGADVQPLNSSGVSALHVAIEGGHPEFPDPVEPVRMLLAAGSDPNAGRYSKPLGLACYWGRHELVDLLLRAGAVVQPEMREEWFWRKSLRSPHAKVRNSVEPNRRLIDSHLMSKSLEGAMGGSDDAPKAPTSGISPL